MSRNEMHQPIDDAEIVALLNTLLEAERAGAKVLSEFMQDYRAESDAWRTLRDVQRDEATNCAILMRLPTPYGPPVHPVFTSQTLALCFAIFSPSIRA